VFIVLCVDFMYIFWQQHAVLGETSTHTHTPPTPRKCNRLLYCILKKSTQKVGKKAAKRQQKSGKKAAKRQQKKMAKNLAKKYTKKAHCHLHNTHANHQKKNFLKHILEPVLLLSWNQSKTGLVNNRTNL